jgi:hypothetical protein
MSSAKSDLERLDEERKGREQVDSLYAKKHGGGKWK